MLEGTLRRPEATAGEDSFPFALAISGSTALLAQEDKVWVFERRTGSWHLSETPLVGSDAHGEPVSSVAISRDTILIGSGNHSIDQQLAQGAVFAFRRGPAAAAVDADGWEVPRHAVRTADPPSSSAIEAACGTPCRCPWFTNGSGGGATARLLASGSFLQVGAEEQLIALEGACEGHGANYGGTVTVRKVQDGWSPVAYSLGFVPRQCSVRRAPDGFDRLLCWDLYFPNGGGWLQSAIAVDLHLGRNVVLFSSSCEDGRDIARADWTCSDCASLDVSIDLVYGIQRANGAKWGGCVTLRDSDQHATLSYLERGDHYEATPETTKRLLRAAGLTASALARADRLPFGLLPKTWPEALRQLE